MEQNDLLGVYLTPEGAYCAVLSGRGSASGIRCFFISASDIAEQGTATMTAIARQAAGQAGVFEQSAIAVRSNLISQYYHHSEFADARQVESTIRFDAEEASAADASTLAVAYEITQSGPGGSDVTLYTASRQILTDLLLDVQAGGMDPTQMEPDAVCLVRALEKTPDFDEKGRMYLLIFDRTCYLITPIHAGMAPKVRTFLLPDEADKTAALARQTILTSAAMTDVGPVKKLILVGHIEGVDRMEMGHRTGMAVEQLDARKLLNLEIPYEVNAEQFNGFLFACGAAMGLAGRCRKADFRRDFMPYQGRRRILQRSFQVVSISLTILFLVFGMYFQVKVLRVKGDASDWDKKLRADYSAAMYGAKPPASESIGSRLRRELNRVKQLQQYGVDENAITARLTYILEAVNKSPASVDVNLKTITISDRSITLAGDTDSRKSTRDLFDSIKSHKRLEVAEERFNANGARDEFNITLKTKDG
jgi:hypothetical protein